MGLLDLFTGRRAAPAGTPRQDPGDLRATLLALNRPTSPVVVRDGGPEGADLVAEWRLVDAAWFEIFAKAGMDKAAQALLRLDDAAGEVRMVQRDWTVEWRAGVPTTSLSAEAFRGRKAELSWGQGYAFREDDLSFGRVYEWRFDARALVNPLRDAVLAAGWSWRPVAFGRL